MKLYCNLSCFVILQKEEVLPYVQLGGENEGVSSIFYLV